MTRHNPMSSFHPASFRVAVLSALVLTLAACGGGPSNPDSFLGKALMGTSEAPEPIDLTKFGPTVRCPPVLIQPGTESFSVYDEDEVSAFNLKHQATIADTAAECGSEGGVMTIKVGIRGRVLSGPKSTVGEVPLPLRVAVTQDGETVVYSELHTIATDLTETERSKPWAKVVENIQVPDQGTLRILVGFDESAS